MDPELLEQIKLGAMPPAPQPPVAQNQPPQPLVAQPPELSPEILEMLQAQLFGPPKKQAPAIAPMIPIAAIIGLSTAAITFMIVSALPTSQANRSLENATIALSNVSQELATNKNRPNIVCIGFGCGEGMRAIAGQQQPTADYRQVFDAAFNTGMEIYPTYTAEQLIQEQRRLQEMAQTQQLTDAQKARVEGLARSLEHFTSPQFTQYQ